MSNIDPGQGYDPIERYSERREDGSVWEVEFDTRTGEYRSAPVAPPEPQSPPQRSRDDVMGPRQYGNPAGAHPPNPSLPPPGAQARRFSPLTQGPTNQPQRPYPGEGGMGRPQPDEYSDFIQSMGGTPAYWMDRYGNTHKDKEWRGTEPPPAEPQSQPPPQPPVPPSSPEVYPSPTVPGGTYPNGMHTRRYGDYTPRVQPQGAAPMNAPASPGGNPNAGEGRGNGRPFVDAPAERYQKYSERRADGNVYEVVYDRQTGEYRSTFNGQSAPNLGEGLRGGGGAADTANPAGLSAADAQWEQEFRYRHAGMGPVQFYMQPNNWKDPQFYAKHGRMPTEREAMAWALADRAWGDALFRERGFAPTFSDWMQNYGNARSQGSPVAPYPGMANTYRGGGGDLGAYGGGGGGGASSPGRWVEGPDGIPIWQG